MCLNLQKIKNPSYGKTTYAQEYGSLVTVNPNLVDKREYIEVPCGKCVECRQSYISSIIQRAIVESMFCYTYFITLTYDNNHIPVLYLNGKKYYYADYKHIQLMFKRFRLVFDRDFRYLCVNEYGDNTHRPHFHVIMFVPILESDNRSTPKLLEKFIFDNLGKYFAINKGTFKNPKYETLFTYKCGYDPIKGITSNYFVKYVDAKEWSSFVNTDFSKTVLVQDETKIKTIRYLLGYVNKLDEYEQSLCQVIEQYKDVDKKKYRKLRSQLKSQVRYSKGFGSGFIDGKKNYMPKISVRCSANAHVYTEIVDSLPESYEEFVDLYPELNEQVLYWRKRDYYQYFSTWKRCKDSMSADDYMLHCVFQFYFSDEFSNIIDRYKRELQPTVSTHFHVVNRKYKYGPSVVRTSKPNTETKIYKYLRSMVEDGIKSKVPYLAFRMDGMQQYVPLCKYYKDRVTTFDDIYHLYEVLGVENYQEWLSLFEKSLNDRKAQKMAGNTAKYFNTDFVQEDIKVDDKYSIYNKLFSKKIN